MTSGANAIDTDAAPTRHALDGIFGYRLRRLQTQWVAHWMKTSRSAGLDLTPVQGGIVMLMDENPGIGQTALAQLLRIEKATLSQTLNPLVDAGLIERRRENADGRAVALHLTAPGARTVSKIRTQTTSHEADLLAGLTSAEQTQFKQLLVKALASADAAVGRTSMHS